MLKSLFALVIIAVSVSSIARTSVPNPQQIWGEDHQILILNTQGGKIISGRIDYDCAYASLEKITVNAHGDFHATGSITHGSGMVPPPGHGPVPIPARFIGKHLASGVLELTVISYPPGEHPESDKVQLKAGYSPMLHRCMASRPR